MEILLFIAFLNEACFSKYFFTKEFFWVFACAWHLSRSRKAYFSHNPPINNRKTVIPIIIPPVILNNI